ncbi:phosphatidylserine/phosphatidylglycerophosphate/cardiolipin synthase family protein [Acidithiobacillus sp. IBUN Pt1247-S3]|uniref:phospholipase D-like domain-containing protein n=1 Tax=Acidithiobacillus sp. IBUN Pt1247-S3 TaxID=3166642 RepID=UPI0034E61970
MKRQRNPAWLPAEDWTLLAEMPKIARWLVERLRAAEHEILFENYIFQVGNWPEEILDILCVKAREGVRVHLRLDALGSHGFPERWIQRLQAAGGEFEWYHRVGWRGWEKSLRRSHRRIVLIDQEWLAVGGFALADAWLCSNPGQLPYREMLFACRGPIVPLVRHLFLKNRPLSRKELRALPSVAMDADPDVVVRLLAGSPPDRFTIRRRYLAAFRSARESLWLATPYFNPDPIVLSALYSAVRRGVDVRVLLAGRVTDHPLLRLGIQAYYQKLLRHRVRVYEYQDSFLHAKYILVDGQWGSVGSANLDFLSLWFNRELNLEITGLPPLTLLRTLFLREFARSREISAEHWRRRPWWRRPLEWVLAQVDRRIQARALGSRRY